MKTKSNWTEKGRVNERKKNRELLVFESDMLGNGHPIKAKFMVCYSKIMCHGRCSLKRRRVDWTRWHITSHVRTNHPFKITILLAQPNNIDDYYSTINIIKLKK
jgi:hypothetical protein